VSTKQIKEEKDDDKGKRLYNSLDEDKHKHKDKKIDKDNNKDNLTPQRDNVILSVWNFFLLSEVFGTFFVI
jgi:hypothetical protein